MLWWCGGGCVQGKDASKDFAMQLLRDIRDFIKAEGGKLAPGQPRPDTARVRCRTLRYCGLPWGADRRVVRHRFNQRARQLR